MRVSPHFPTFYTIQLIKAEKEKRKVNGEARSDIIPVIEIEMEKLIEMESWTWITTQHLFFVCLFFKALVASLRIESDQ